MASMAFVDGVGVVGEVLLAERAEVVEGDHPVAVAGAVEEHHLVEVGQLGAVLAELGHLLVVLGEDHAALGVGEDVADVLGDGRGVDRRGGAAGAHDREVGEDPLDAGARGDADALLRARCPSASRPAASFSTLSPVSFQVHDSHGWSSADGEPVGLPVGPLVHALAELRRPRWAARFSMNEVSVLTGDMACSWVAGTGSGEAGAVTCQ